jgi:carbon-monoxide dehydrogenase medium subunit
MPLREFIVGKRRTALEPEELITEVSFPELNASSWCTFEKVGRRNSLIIALVSIAVCLELDPKVGGIKQIRVALNRIRGKTPERAASIEERLTGRVLSEDTIAEGVRLLADELRLTSDYRASAAYRAEAVKACFERAINRCAEGIARQRDTHV